MTEYKGYLIEAMFRGVRISLGDNVVTKLKGNYTLKDGEHEVDKIVASKEHFMEIQKKKLKDNFTSPRTNVWIAIT